MHFRWMQETVTLYFCGREKKKTTQEQRLAKPRWDSASYRNMRGCTYERVYPELRTALITWQTASGERIHRYAKFTIMDYAMIVDSVILTIIYIYRLLLDIYIRTECTIVYIERLCCLKEKEKGNEICWVPFYTIVYF